MESLDELVGFLRPDTRLDIKSLALHHVLSLTGEFESRKLLISHPKMITNVILLAFKKDEQKSISKDSFFTLINLSADELDAKHLIEKNPVLVRLLLEYVLDENSSFSNNACAVLSNLSRGNTNTELICKYFEDLQVDDKEKSDSTNKPSKITLERLFRVFCTENFNKTNNLNYLAPFICNLTQSSVVRKKILDDKILLLRLIPYINYSKSIIRRGGTIGAIKNCCFEYDYHEELLFSSEIDILGRLLLPLAGPEDFDTEEMERLPDDLQYLPPEKERESDPDIRNMLLETIMNLCSHQKCRTYIKDKNAYIILNELYKWEKDETVKITCEKLIHLLISDEPMNGMEDLHKVVIPHELSTKFYEFDHKELEKNFQE